MVACGSHSAVSFCCLHYSDYSWVAFWSRLSSQKSCGTWEKSAAFMISMLFRGHSAISPNILSGLLRDEKAPFWPVFFYLTEVRISWVKYASKLSCKHHFPSRSPCLLCVTSKVNGGFRWYHISIFIINHFSSLQTVSYRSCSPLLPSRCECMHFLI